VTPSPANADEPTVAMAQPMSNSHPHANPVWLDQQQFSVQFSTARVLVEMSEKPRYDCPHRFGSIPNLKRNNSTMARRRIRSDIREITVQRYEQGVKFFGLAQDNRIG
jgi:hypothetical protein